MILAGDIGGTKVNLALFDGKTRIRQKRYESRNFSGIGQVLDDFLKDYDAKVEKACFGVAGRVVEGKCQLTNLSWQVVDSEDLRKHLGLSAVWLINDLAATAYAVPFLSSVAFEVLQNGTPVNEGRIAVVSAGTGLGQAFLVPDKNGNYIVMDSEGGHCDFSPRNTLEAELLFFLQKKYSRVSIERVLSGPGLLDIYEFFKTEEQEPADSPANIVEKAIAKTSPICEKTVKLFISLYGALAGNLALQYLSEGGVYLGGGIAPKIIPLLQEGGFMEAFLSKGRFEKYLSEIPVKVVMDESAPLQGAARYALVL
jgi:glucokinase